jgi:hypothetical protein
MERRPATALAGLLLGTLLACSPEADPEPKGVARRERVEASSAQPAARAPTEAERRLAECIEAGVHGPGYDELAPRDARRKLKRLEAKAACEEQLVR